MEGERREYDGMLKGTYYTARCECGEPLQAVLKIGLL
jgi:hypothetical protein